MSPILDGFHPAVRTWFVARFDAPSRAQELGWPAIADAQQSPGGDVLLCAPTGGGKTLAAFMWAINRLVVQAEARELRDEVSVLYVSPLKALANDIRLNLDEPLSGVRDAGAALGFDFSAIRAGLRTGDTPVAERAAMLRRPPHILVTTPESLFILLTSPKFREKLRSIRYVIVDELHAIAGNKRGAHLAITLERLERLVRASNGWRPARIGLSATLNPIETLAHFLGGCEVGASGERRPRAVQIVRADDRPRQLDLQVIAPGPELGSLATHQHWEAMYDALARLIREHRTTLVFTLSRRWAERIALALQKRVGADAIMAHHGSLARAERLNAEQRLKRGDLKAIVATASLELGIDVGAVDLACQVDSPKSVSAAIQRIGRSGHSLGATPKGRFFALTLDDLIECAAAVRAIRNGHLDEVEIPSACLDVAAQQIVSIAAEEGDISEQDLLAILRSAYGFGGLALDGLRRLLADMATQLSERIQGANPKIFYDTLGGRVRARRGGRLAAITSGGTIPESGNLDVVIASEGRKIGDIEEDFAQESSRGDIFSLGSMPWRVLGISKNRFLVEPAPGMAPSLPFWQTEASGRSFALSAEACSLRREIAARSQSGNESAAIEWLVRECALDEASAGQAVSYVRRGVAALGAIPDERTLVVERFFDGLGGTQVVIHAPFGIRFNRALGLALRKKLCQQFDFEIQASAIDDACLLALNSRHSFPLNDLLALINSRTARHTLVQALLDSPMFEVRFRHVATRALAIARSMRGRKVAAWIQRLRSQELITALFPQRNACFENRPPAIEVPGHFIVDEAVHECLNETADVERLQALLGGIENGSVRVIAVDSVAPSVFAHRILLAWDYSFLDDGERANRRSRTVTMNRAMAEDVFRKEDLAEMLSNDAVESVTAEVSGRAPSSRARDADELYELISSHGALAPDAIPLRVQADAEVLLAALDREGRVLRVSAAHDASETIIARKDAALYTAAYPDLRSSQEISPQSELDPGAARKEIVRRFLATSGPVTDVELGARLRMSPADIANALIALESEGAVFRGHFTAAARTAGNGSVGAADELQWCDRYVLERIHRRTLNRLRAEVEPCGDAEFAAFRFRWAHIVDSTLPGGVDGVRTVLKQMQGLAFAPEFWERSILRARVPDYRPEYLDLLCMSGEFSWTAPRHSKEEGERLPDFPARVSFVPRGSRLHAPSGPLPDESAARAVADALSRFGAQYLDQIADRAGISERDTLSALWRLAAAGAVSNDSFAPLRLLWSDHRSHDAIAGGGAVDRHDAALRARLKSSVSGRWSMLTTRDEESAYTGAEKPRPDEFDQARELASMLLQRHGILAREMMAQEAVEISWHDLSFALRRMEYAGNIRRGWFVRSLSGDQYALPEALETLRAVRSAADNQKSLVAISAADPANPYGILIPGCGVSRDPGNLIVLRGGVPIMGIASRAIVTMQPLDDAAFSAALSVLIRLLGKVCIETIDGALALESDRVIATATMGFHSDGRALVYDGLPGPLPARAAAARSTA